MKLQGIKIEETGKIFVRWNYQKSKNFVYLLNGREIDIPPHSDFLFDENDKIQLKKFETKLLGFKDVVGDKYFSVKQVQELSESEILENEYEAKRIYRDCEPIRETGETIEEIELVFDVVRNDTKNPFIKSVLNSLVSFNNTTKLYTYDRQNALVFIVKEYAKTKNITVVESPGVSAFNADDNSLFINVTDFLNSKLFGKYVFKSLSGKRVYDDIEKLENLYQKDVTEIERIIDIEYNLKFKKIKFDINDMLNSTKGVLGNVLRIDCKKGDTALLSLIIKKLNIMVESLENTLLE